MSEWDDLLSDSRAVVQELEREGAVSVGNLVHDVLAYRRWIRRAAGPVTDIALAERLTRANIQLLGSVLHAAPSQQRLAQIAARYFITRTDGDDDLSSPFGFDDDAEVFNAIVRRLGLAHQQVPLLV